ncbi:MAG TPA: methionine biosynthesis protein MetW [Methanoregulaceae archaeon]|nr:methionine biosynthesis protein MetW [Methanoregulaceae archaeon]
MDKEELFGIDDDEIDVEESMKKIRENLRRKKKKMFESPHPEFPGRHSASSRTLPISDMSPDDARDMACLSGNWDIQNASYTIRSHRPIVGRLLVRGRDLVHGEVRRYTDPIIWRQTEFNRAASTQISRLNQRVAAIESQCHGKKSPRSPLPSVYGETAEAGILERQAGFLPSLENARNVLVIGSGGGDLLEAMRQEGIVARGVDADPACVSFCQSRGFEAECNDPIPYLEQVKDASLDGIVLDWKRGQPGPADAIRLLHLCCQKIKPGGYCILESINPLSYTSFTRVFHTMADVNPIHPDALKYLFESVGFSEVQIRFSDSMPDLPRLQRLPSTKEDDEETRKRIEIQNKNIDMVNEVLYGPFCYTVTGRR